MRRKSPSSSSTSDCGGTAGAGTDEFEVDGRCQCLLVGRCCAQKVRGLIGSRGAQGEEMVGAPANVGVCDLLPVLTESGIDVVVAFGGFDHRGADSIVCHGVPVDDPLMVRHVDRMNLTRAPVQSRTMDGYDGEPPHAAEEQSRGKHDGDDRKTYAQARPRTILRLTSSDICHGSIVAVATHPMATHPAAAHPAAAEPVLTSETAAAAFSRTIGSSQVVLATC